MLLSNIHEHSKKVLIRIGEGLLDTLYPPVCPMCGRRVIENNEFTQNYTPYRICYPCFRSLPRTEHAYLRGNVVEMLFQTRLRFERGGAFLRFEKQHPVQRLVHHIKFGTWPTSGPSLAYYLGVQAALEWVDYGWFEGMDMLVPIPLHVRRLRERGFNQSEYIARGISDVTGIPVRTDILRRVCRTHQQALLAGDERDRNVKGAFELMTDIRTLRHAHVLLIDDLITTGSTINAAIDALHQSHTCRYSVFAIGKAI